MSAFQYDTQGEEPSGGGKIFYRVAKIETQQGLWYDFAGKFTGLIHNEMDFCLNRDLKMDYDPELVGFLSATDSLDTLFKWFPENDILRLQENGWFIHLYEAREVKFYEPFQHQIIEASSSRLIKTLAL